MEAVIKHLKCIIGLIIFILFLNAGVAGQNNNDAVLEAFSSSYVFENEGEFTKAANELKNIYQEDSYEINLRLGWLTYNSGLFSESAAYYQKAINLKPLSIEARLGYAYPSSAMGNWNYVIGKYEEILEIDPENSLVNYRMGSIYYGKEDYETALKYFEKAANYYPFDYDITIMFAWTNYRLGKLREARVLFQKALLRKPGAESALEGLELIK